jgi:hypothetical protein
VRSFLRSPLLAAADLQIRPKYKNVRCQPIFENHYRLRERPSARTINIHMPIAAASGRLSLLRMCLRKKCCTSSHSVSSVWQNLFTPAINPKSRAYKRLFATGVVYVLRWTIIRSELCPRDERTPFLRLFRSLAEFVSAKLFESRNIEFPESRCFMMVGRNGVRIINFFIVYR